MTSKTSNLALGTFPPHNSIKSETFLKYKNALAVDPKHHKLVIKPGKRRGGKHLIK